MKKGRALSLKLSTRYALITGGIVGGFFILFAVLSYAYLRDQAVQETRQKAQLVSAMMDGIGAYVSGALRPRMFEITSRLQHEEEFIAEAMSTTHIKQGIVKRLPENFQGFVFRRVSERPRNPVNMADPLHASKLAFFSERPGTNSWQGLTNLDGGEFFFMVKPVYAAKDCLKCHGDPKDAPAGLLNRYGTERGFGWKEGDLMGVESVCFPLDPVLDRIHQTAINILLVGLTLAAILFLAIEGSFVRLVSLPLRRLSATFVSMAQGIKPLRQGVEVRTDDEIGDLGASFNALARQLAEAQETLSYNNVLLQSVLNGITDPIALTNRDCSLAVMNSSYQDWIARKSPAVLGRTCHDLPHEIEIPCPACLLEAVFEKGVPLDKEWKGPDGRTYQTRLFPISDKTGAVSQVVHCIRDITSEKEAESRMLHAEKLAAIGQLSAGLAHEINNPLGVIHCYTNLIKRELPPGSGMTRDLSVIEKHVQTCRQIVDGLLSFARIEKTEKRKADLNAGIMEMVSMVKRQMEKANVMIETRLDPALPLFFFDPTRMKQVFLNLILNASQAIKDTGTITIRSVWDPAISRATVIVEDTGMGIPEENIARIFDPFFTTKKTGEGTGLGLSVSYGIVKEHGGEITVRSETGKGSVFTVSIPVDHHDI